MELIVLGSSSSGNGYILKGSKDALIIECGLPVKVAMKSIDFELSLVSGAIVSHKHGDHGKYIPQYIDKGIDVYVGDDHSIKSHRIQLYEHKTMFQVGRFKIIPLEVEHDVKCHSFMIQHPECGLIYFVTDTHFIKYRPMGINHMIVECNYDECILDDNLISGKVHGIVRDRVLTSHLSLQNLCKWLDKVEINETKQIILTHLSNANADGEKFKNYVQSRTGKPTHIAKTGTTFKIGKRPF